MQEQCDVCTFRNNLNKIFSTPLDLRSSWVVDACKVGSIMYLDIHQLPQKTFPNADLFQYYGYKSVPSLLTPVLNAADSLPFPTGRTGLLLQWQLKMKVTCDWHLLIHCA